MEVVEYIAGQLEDKNPADDYGYTPLHIAAVRGHFDIFKYIADNLENKNPSDDDGETPRSLATENSHIEIVEYFKAQKRPKFGNK